MVWESLSFIDGEILYADSHMNPLQDNFGAFATQESGAPMIDVSSANINLLTTSEFICNHATINSFDGSGIIANVGSISTFEMSSSFHSFAGNVEKLGVGSANITQNLIYRAKPFYACRAWVNFDGTGVVSINAAGNVSSITDNGVGEYTINFTIALSSADYSYAFAAAFNNVTVAPKAVVGTGVNVPPTTTALRIEVSRVDTSVIVDSVKITAIIVG